MPPGICGASDSGTGCGFTTCPNGCCSAAGVCMQPPSPNACGTGGAACAVCTSGEQCFNGQCMQITATCLNTTCSGCCDSFGMCQSPDTNHCGVNGGACTACVGSGEVCSGSGQCVSACGAMACPGCCTSTGTCIPLPTDQQCGGPGQMCTNCTLASGSCLNNQCAYPGCGPGNCPKGCCTSTGCQLGTSALACGSNGTGCATCGANQECDAGACTYLPINPDAGLPADAGTPPIGPILASLGCDQTGGASILALLWLSALVRRPRTRHG